MPASSPAGAAPAGMDKALQVLRETFGLREFHSLQVDIIGAMLRGRNAVVIMPTGGGKSLCYQIPAMLRRGTGVVVSPLIALMKDQVDALRQHGVRAACLNSSMSFAEQRGVEKQLRARELDLLYVAPERLLGDATLALLDEIEIALFAIDEAHCVSRWGHDFRPEYIQLLTLAERFADVPRIALTATADDATRRDIAERLALQDAEKFVAGLDRPNITYLINQESGAKQAVLEFIREKHPGESGIVYCLSR
ncbi:MAG: RecQ family ATP-dependent DNA helicase, partial [Gammaproteobacteria bacterium]